ncbi:MAG: carbohydrate kinase family protein [Candidatus Bathyarchaeota archaeon]|nr:MAG: carbohydrate kinase family protein [Candidatus Bathyarchaeota archaeon]
MKKVTVVVMPDFFLDRIVAYGGTPGAFCEAITEVTERYGGSLHGIRQAVLRGGNAANTAAALASLGVKVCPLIKTSLLGYQLLKYYLAPFQVDLSHVKIDGTMALTTALELTYRGKKANVMMSNLGSLAEFSLEDLTSEDFQLFHEADYVCIFNWAATKHWGTEVAKGVFETVKSEGKGKTYFDTSDPRPNKENVPKLMKRVLLSNLVDRLSVNESEALYFASQLSREAAGLRKNSNADTKARMSARILAKTLSARIDLHTPRFAGSFTGQTEIVVPAFKVHALRATGAGDAWNAGNILGDVLNLSDNQRLTLANAVAAYYVSNSNAEHPTVNKLQEFCSAALL